DVVVEQRLTNLMAKPQPYLHLVKIAPNHFAIEVEMVTDIDNSDFIETFKKAVTKYWHTTGKIEYQVHLNIKQVTAQQIYKGEQVPVKGSAIDLAKHIAHFPADRAILTTGAGTMHYETNSGRYYVVIGTTDIGDRVLAHEFGHILNLDDAYFRGYRDIGANGFE